ncbi:hypothetical protein TW95_gp1277 [Pandoravirus inopinatum]|uniref:Uncharacterized protein n=1 Tax=Pandoravirus inopinatum TaxID=1605721 RepID=A0A0B5JAM6_9VIRU|nr:hypothetical protein TW95_gp1277 [Pandoravirus inopinatum]AJF98011.1 hypothetical protein [Pandoravirus inopinatum]
MTYFYILCEKKRHKKVPMLFGRSCRSARQKVRPPWCPCSLPGPVCRPLGGFGTFCFFFKSMEKADTLTHTFLARHFWAHKNPKKRDLNKGNLERWPTRSNASSSHNKDALFCRQGFGTRRRCQRTPIVDLFFLRHKEKATVFMDNENTEGVRGNRGKKKKWSCAGR